MDETCVECGKKLDPANQLVFKTPGDTLTCYECWSAPGSYDEHVRYMEFQQEEADSLWAEDVWERFPDRNVTPENYPISYTEDGIPF